VVDWAGRSGCSRIHCEYTSRKALAVEAFYRRFEVPGIVEFDEAEPTGVACNPVPDDLGKADRMTLIFEPLT
jgi:hypothetical protein